MNLGRVVWCVEVTVIVLPVTSVPCRCLFRSKYGKIDRMHSLSRLRLNVKKPRKVFRSKWSKVRYYGKRWVKKGGRWVLVPAGYQAYRRRAQIARPIGAYLKRRFYRWKGKKSLEGSGIVGFHPGGPRPPPPPRRLKARFPNTYRYGYRSEL